MSNLMDKVDKAIKLLQDFEPKQGYYVAFSGGKDSCVIYDLVKRSGVKYDVHHSTTTIDPPEMMKWMKKAYPEVIREKGNSMFEIVAKEKVLPTRLNRFCCWYLKEGGSENRLVINGIRAEESQKRKDRELIEYDTKRNKIIFNIILDWTELDVWAYIDANEINYCPLYDKGKDRIGCVACPQMGVKKMKREFEQYPHIKKGYLRAIKKAMDNGGFKQFENPEDVFNWWVSDESIKNYLELKNQLELI